MDTRSRRKFVGSMMAAAAASPMLIAQDRGATPAAQTPGGGGQRASQLRPAGLAWVSGQGSNDGVPNADAPARIPVTAPWEEHCKYTMDALKRAVEKLGGTMDSFVYLNVFFCLPLDDSIPLPQGSAKAAMYQKCYSSLSPIYGSYFKSAPPRSCFALEWIPGTSLLEIVGAAYIPPAAGA